MFDEGEVMATLTVWLGLVFVTVWYVARIALMLRGQRAMERSYRLRLAVLRGKAIREMAKTTEPST